ncbi:hypothetical protein [Foetidibacter luteolus]|uniref:hypothetical protein n=1 Tax=Foetidibacter luteolus TaxID=2608880 RepID=UPI00129B7803|nr:hypothetical protein [Foetidibacter luteolus]
MKFKDFELKSDNHFVAMQYYGLILNRTFLVLLTTDLIIGIKVNGLVSVESGGSLLAKEATKTMAIKGDLQNPYSYIKSKYIDKVQDIELLNGNILMLDKSNFVIRRADIKNAYYDPRKKWGMGYYPHDGKVYILTNDGKKKEFIILGNQSGQHIANLVLAK